MLSMSDEMDLNENVVFIFFTFIYYITTDNPIVWSVDQVYQWMKDEVGKNDASILRVNRVNGQQLITLTKEQLLRPPYSISKDNVTKLTQAIEKLKLIAGNFKEQERQIMKF
jgi:hypothetical protein